MAGPGNDQHVRAARPGCGVADIEHDTLGQAARTRGRPAVLDRNCVDIDAMAGGGRLGGERAQPQLRSPATEVDHVLTVGWTERADQLVSSGHRQRVMEDQIIVAWGDHRLRHAQQNGDPTTAAATAVALDYYIGQVRQLDFAVSSLRICGCRDTAEAHPK